MLQHHSRDELNNHSYWIDECLSPRWMFFPLKESNNLEVPRTEWRGSSEAFIQSETQDFQLTFLYPYFFVSSLWSGSFRVALLKSFFFFCSSVEVLSALLREVHFKVECCWSGPNDLVRMISGNLCETVIIMLYQMFMVTERLCPDGWGYFLCDCASTLRQKAQPVQKHYHRSICCVMFVTVHLHCSLSLSATLSYYTLGQCTFVA